MNLLILTPIRIAMLLHPVFRSARLRQKKSESFAALGLLHYLLRYSVRYASI